MFQRAGELERARWGLLLLLALAALMLAATPPQAAFAHRQSALAKVAAATPGRQVTVIVQLRRGVDPSTARRLVEAAGGEVVGELPIINGLVAKLPARRPRRSPGIPASAPSP
jgi:hypothetical protein